MLIANVEMTTNNLKRTLYQLEKRLFNIWYVSSQYFSLHTFT